MPDNLKYASINDFRHGIITNIRSATDAALDMPPGTANEGTVGCFANATGQLCPLPGPVFFTTITTSAGGGTSPAWSVFSTGLAAIGPMSGNPAGAPGVQLQRDEIHAFFSSLVLSGGFSLDTFEWWVVKPDGVRVQLVLYHPTVGINNTVSKRGTTHIYTRGRRSTFSTPGFPIIATEWTGVVGNPPYVNGSTQAYYVYPDPNALTSDTPYSELGTVGTGAAPNVVYGGPLVAHSGRILRLLEQGLAFGANWLQYTNEKVRYTDPPNSVQLSTSGATDSVLDPQIPGGYGSWGSVSFGELLLVKRAGGALLVEGDIYAPQITRLAGVTPTGDCQNPATATPVGLLYCVENDGAYLWAGGSQSQKVNKISDTFYLGEVMSWGNKTDHDLWNNLVVFTNGWVYDYVNDSWWQLQDPYTAPRHIQWVAAGIGDPGKLYVIANQANTPGSNGDFDIYVYDRTIPTSSYTWISQPIPVSQYQNIDIREIELAVSGPITNGTTKATFTFYDPAGQASSPEVMFLNTPSGSNIVTARTRRPIGIRANSIVFKVVVDTADPTKPAPIINSITFGYVENAPFGPQQV